MKKFNSNPINFVKSNHKIQLPTMWVSFYLDFIVLKFFLSWCARFWTHSSMLAIYVVEHHVQWSPIDARIWVMQLDDSPKDMKNGKSKKIVATIDDVT